jgi:hypothetical protein
LSESSPTDGKKEYKIVRRQLPLALSEAQTFHKSQSQTYVRAAVCVGKNVFRGHLSDMLYTALSRVTKLDGLYLLGDMPNFFETKTRANKMRDKRPEAQGQCRGAQVES